jgi:hypothetical protein
MPWDPSVSDRAFVKLTRERAASQFAAPLTFAVNFSVPQPRLTLGDVLRDAPMVSISGVI